MVLRLNTVPRGFAFISGGWDLYYRRCNAACIAAGGPTSGSGCRSQSDWQCLLSDLPQLGGMGVDLKSPQDGMDGVLTHHVGGCHSVTRWT